MACQSLTEWHRFNKVHTYCSAIVKGRTPAISRDILAIMTLFKPEIDRETARLRKLANINISVHTPVYEKILLAHIQLQRCATA